MPCLRCGVDYGIFKKESFCRNCGFSYCSSCLTKKIVVPKLGTNKHTVCHNCFSLLSSGKTTGSAEKKNRPPSPPAALQKRMDELKSSGAAFNGSSHGCSSNPKNEDSVLASRLESLRADRMQGPIPSLSQLEDRLARLKGVQGNLGDLNEQANGPVAGSRSFMDAGQKRTVVQQTQQLFQQATDEINLDAVAPNSDDEIRRRLEQLRSNDVSLNDLNKKPEVIESNGTADPAAQKSFPLTSMISDDSATVADAHVLEVWQCILEAEREACREAEEALQLQEKDRELKVKLEEIRANRDTSTGSKRLSTAASKLHASTSDCYSDEDNEDKLADKVVQQFLSEACLDTSSAALRQGGKRRAERKQINSSEQDSDESEELPWCTICNNDASLRCYGCEGDLYCRQCFKECHDTQDLKEHPCVAYKVGDRNGNC